MNRFFASLFLIVAFAPEAIQAIVDSDFEPISNVPQDVSSIRTFVKCPKRGKHTKAMVTILPSSADDESVKVLTFPADLVKAINENKNELQLEWNEDVAFDGDIDEAGVQIQFPASKLQAVLVSSDSKAQVFEGFSNLDTLKISSDAQLWANFTALTGSTSLPDMSEISVSSDGQAYIYTDTSAVSSVTVSSDAVLHLSAPNAVVSSVKVSSDARAAMKVASISESTRVSSDAELSIEGDLMGRTEVSSDAVTKVYGSHTVSGSIKVSSDGRLYVGKDATLDASIEVRSDAKIYAPNCENVSTSSDGKCYVDTAIDGSVKVTVEKQPLTRTGTERCNPFLDWDFSFNGTGAAIMGILIAIGIFVCCRRRWKRKCRELDASPTPAVMADAEIMDGTKAPYGSKDYETGSAAPQVAEATVIGFEDITVDPEKQVTVTHLTK